MFDANEANREAQANVIYETFIAPNASLQVNISYEDRLQVEKNLFEKPLESTAFDQAMLEVHNMMVGVVDVLSLYVTFVLTYSLLVLCGHVFVATSGQGFFCAISVLSDL